MPRKTYTDEQFRSSFAERTGAPNLGPFKAGCREWIGARTVGGYGMLRRLGRARMATHVSLELHDGIPVPAGVMVLHSCDNPPCVEPAHLRRGTQFENMADRHARGAIPEARPGSAKQGDRRGRWWP